MWPFDIFVPDLSAVEKLARLFLCFFWFSLRACNLRCWKFGTAEQGGEFDGSYAILGQESCRERNTLVSNTLNAELTVGRIRAYIALHLYFCSRFM